MTKRREKASRTISTESSLLFHSVLDVFLFCICFPPLVSDKRTCLSKKKLSSIRIAWSCMISMRTITDTSALPSVRPGDTGDDNHLVLTTMTRRDSSISSSSSHRRSNSNSSALGSMTSDYLSLASSPSTSPSSLVDCISSTDDSLEQNDEEYFAQFLCPSESEDDSIPCDDDEKEENDESYLDRHLHRQHLSSLDRWETHGYQRSKRSKKKVNAQRQIKSKHARSIQTNSHQKHLYMHHRLVKRVILDPPKSHYIPSPTPVPSYSYDELRSIVARLRQANRSVYSFHRTRPNHARLSKNSYDTYVDESQVNAAAYQYREYTIHEFNIPDEPSFDDDMINFLLDMQNRDLSPEDYEMLLRLDERVQRRTLNANVLESLPTVVVNESHVDEQCSICMEKYVLDQEMKLLPCQHIFHSTCIETYLKEFSIQCPLDNLPLI